MITKRKVEVFSAGCSACEDTIQLVHDLACESCDVTILDMHDAAVAARGRKLGVRSVPAVAIDSQRAGCCAGRGPEATTLHATGLGQAR